MDETTKAEFEKLLKLINATDTNTEEAEKTTEEHLPKAEHILARLVYDTLTDNLMDKYKIPGVENAYATDSSCYRLYDEMLQTAWRVAKHLNNSDFDTHPDVDLIINNLLKIQEILCLKMFYYGTKLKIE